MKTPLELLREIHPDNDSQASRELEHRLAEASQTIETLKESPEHARILNKIALRLSAADSSEGGSDSAK